MYGLEPAFEQLEDVRLEHAHDGQLRQRQRARLVIREAGGWATVLHTVQDRKPGGWSGARYVLVRWRRLAGRWRIFATFNLAPADLYALRSMTRGMVAPPPSLDKDEAPCGCSQTTDSIAPSSIEPTRT